MCLIFFQTNNNVFNSYQLNFVKKSYQFFFEEAKMEYITKNKVSF